MGKTKEDVRTDGKAVYYAVLYPSMRKAALEHGYALCLHGSMARDMDILAVPWVENVSSVEVLVSAISDCIDGTVWKDYHSKKFENKPHGRISFTLSIMGDWTIDLSVIPPLPAPPSQTKQIKQ